MSRETESAQRPWRRRLSGFILHALVFPFCLIFFSVIAVVIAYCLVWPEKVVTEVQEQLSASTKLPWRINGAIYPMLTPALGIRALDVLILAASEQQSGLCNLDRPLIQAKEVYVTIEANTLFSLNPRIKLIRLESPGIHLTYDEQQRPLWLPLSDAAEAENGADPAGGKAAASKKSASSSADSATTPAPAQDKIALAEKALPPKSLPVPERLRSGAETPAPAERRDSLQNFADILMGLQNSAFPPMHITKGSFASFTVAGDKLLAFKNIEADINPHLPAGHLTMTADFSLPDADLEIPFRLEATLGSEGTPARGNIAGEIAMTPPGSRTLRGSFTSNFTLHRDGRSLSLPDFRVVAEGDGLTANLKADLEKISCAGEVQLHKLSLPRWFGFGRSLPPGLQQPMDGLIGEFDLFLDAHGAEAWNLRGAVGPLAVSGYVGVKDYGAPEVVVDLDLDRANLDLIFPFLAKAGKYVPDPRMPEFDHPVLAPYPDDPARVPGPDDYGVEVSYDVKVRVAKPRVHDVDAGPLEVRVFPVRTVGIEKTRVAFDKVSVLEGGVAGVLDIDDKAIIMRYDVANAELGLLPENLDNETRVSGRVTGRCVIEMPINANGDIEDVWPLTTDAVISACDITGRRSEGRWQLFAGAAKASGKGSIYTVLSKGIRIEGLWDISAQALKSSWNPKGADSISGQFNGALIWPPIERKPRRSRRELPTLERIGMDRLAGDVSLNGSMAAPLGNLVVPVKGKMTSRLTWLTASEKISLENIKFEGFGSYAEGRMGIDFSGKDLLIESDFSSKMNPRLLLKEWGLTPSPSVSMPKVVTGKASVRSTGDAVSFQNLKIEADGAPISGEIFWQSAEPSRSAAKDPGQWNFRLTAEHLDLDNYLPPPPKNKSEAPPPSEEPWNLKPFSNLALDARITLRKAKYRQLTFSNSKITATLQRDRFSVHAEVGDFYSGKATLLFQGTLVPSASQVSLRKGLLQMQNISLGEALYDYTKEQFYAGSGEIVADIAGNMTCDADVPRKLSGIWSMHIKDGMYPALLGTEKSNLRNTFSSASASGPVSFGIISSNNFRLTGPLVDMSGGGTLNLATSQMDIGVSVTFAKVPTVPVRFTGTTDKPKMEIRGASMVVETVQAAGVGVFSLIKNVLELPAHAVRGINSLVEKEKK